MAHSTSVVIRIATPFKSIIGQLVPFLAGDLTSFAPDAKR
jgi:hypothetical protein